MTKIGTLQEFSEVAEAVAATTKKLEKAAILGEYLKSLSDPDLSRAARYFAGHQFAESDSRTTNVGGSIITASLREVTGFSADDLYQRYVRLGDPGELASEIIKEANPAVVSTLTLVEAESLITRLSETRGIKNKTAILSTALRQATYLEAKYLIMLLMKACKSTVVMDLCRSIRLKGPTVTPVLTESSKERMKSTVYWC